MNAELLETVLNNTLRKINELENRVMRLEQFEMQRQKKSQETFKKLQELKEKNEQGINESQNQDA